LGGLGLTKLHQLAAYAHVASVYATQGMLALLCPAAARAYADALPREQVGDSAGLLDPNAVDLMDTDLPLPLQIRFRQAVLALLPTARAELPDLLAAPPLTARAQLLADPAARRGPGGSRRRSAPTAPRRPRSGPAPAGGPSPPRQEPDGPLDPAARLQHRLVRHLHGHNAAALADSLRPPDPGPGPPPTVAARRATIRPLSRLVSNQGGGLRWLDALPTWGQRMTDADVLYAVLPLLGLPLPELRGRIPLCCHRCGEPVDPLHPQAHYGGRCAHGHREGTKRHDFNQTYSMIPIARKLPGRPAVDNNVPGCPPGHEMDVVVDNVSASVPVWLDGAEYEPLADSHVEAAAVRPGAAARAAEKDKEDTYHTAPGHPHPLINPARALYVTWAVETTGTLGQELCAFLSKMARASAVEELHVVGEPSEDLRRRVAALAARTYRSWTTTASLVAVQAQSRFLQRCVRRSMAAARGVRPQEITVSLARPPGLLSGGGPEPLRRCLIVGHAGGGGRVGGGRAQYCFSCHADTVPSPGKEGFNGPGSNRRRGVQRGGLLRGQMVREVRIPQVRAHPPKPWALLPLRRSPLSPFPQPTAPPVPTAKPTGVAWTPLSGWRQGVWRRGRGRRGSHPEPISSDDACPRPAASAPTAAAPYPVEAPPPRAPMPRPLRTPISPPHQPAAPPAPAAKPTVAWTRSRWGGAWRGWGSSNPVPITSGACLSRVASSAVHPLAGVLACCRHTHRRSPSTGMPWWNTSVETLYVVEELAAAA
jgi:hypothetical protein